MVKLRAHFPDEFFLPEILNRKVRENWKALGSRHLSEVAEERASELIEKDIENGLDEIQVKELDDLVNNFLKQVAED